MISIILIILAAAIAGVVLLAVRGGNGNGNTSSSTLSSSSESSSPSTTTTVSTIEPRVQHTTIIQGLSNPWDITFVGENVFFYTQRGGEIRGHDTETNDDWLITKPEDIYARGEGGLMGAIADVNFRSNRYLYTCMNVKGSAANPSVVVSRWHLMPDLRSIRSREDIVTGLPSNSSGRHSGCRLAMGKDGVLWIGTGDTATDGAIPQDPDNLGGKILRVDYEGNAVEGNLGDPFDARIFSYGHRNTQGLFLFDEPINGVYGFSSEHGSHVDDEVNLLKAGNFGWNPVPGYNEAEPMTDLDEFPDAVPAIWNSGPTIAVSGMTVVRGEQWEAWNGAVLLAVQKNSHIRLLRFDQDYKLTREEAVINGFGRIRTVVQAPDGNLYFATDNGNGRDVIVRTSVVE